MAEIPYASPQPPEYRVGTLTYTKMGLAALFLWLLWGDVCFTLMEEVAPNYILPIEFKKLGASDLFVSLTLSVIPQIINVCTNPIISSKSDRFRSRWGRRIPFIVVTIPILVLLLLGIAFAQPLGFTLHKSLASLGRFSPNTVALWTTGGMFILWWMFNMFVATTYWYLFNDVVPEHLLARFMSWFKFVSLMATSLYNWFIFPYAKTHATEIFIGTAALYLFGFGLMCYKVREGQYPPPPPLEGGRHGPIAAVKTYTKECYSLWHYWCVFMVAIGMGAYLVTAPFMQYFYEASKLDQTQLSRARSALNFGTAVAFLGTGWLADRFHPIRIVIVGVLLQIFVATPASLYFLVYNPDQQTSYIVWMIITIAVLSPVTALWSVLDPPMFMRVFPRSRYGQFCSANALVRAASIVVSGILLAYFLDFVENTWHDKRIRYTALPIWQGVAFVIMLVGMLCLYRSWKKYGGDQAYVAPVRTGNQIVPDSEAAVTTTDAALGGPH